MSQPINTQKIIRSRDQEIQEAQDLEQLRDAIMDAQTLQEVTAIMIDNHVLMDRHKEYYQLALDARKRIRTKKIILNGITPISEQN